MSGHLPPDRRTSVMPSYTRNSDWSGFRIQPEVVTAALRPESRAKSRSTRHMNAAECKPDAANTEAMYVEH